MNVRAWARFAAVIFARVLLAGSLGMLFWAVAPTAIGWHTTTVMTASMAPAIEPGDLVVSRPAPYGPLHPGRCSSRKTLTIVDGFGSIDSTPYAMASSSPKGTRTGKQTLRPSVEPTCKGLDTSASPGSESQCVPYLLETCAQ